MKYLCVSLKSISSKRSATTTTTPKKRTKKLRYTQTPRCNATKIRLAVTPFVTLPHKLIFLEHKAALSRVIIKRLMIFPLWMYVPMDDGLLHFSFYSPSFSSRIWFVLFCCTFLRVFSFCFFLLHDNNYDGEADAIVTVSTFVYCSSFHFISFWVTNSIFAVVAVHSE